MADTVTDRCRVAALLTCHNRRALTVAAIEAVDAAATAAGVELSIHLVDDGSTDGTADAVRAQFPSARIITGDGNLYWNQGMRRAWTDAIEVNPDYFLWLNDDLALQPDSLFRLLIAQRRAEADHDGKVITIGMTADPDTGEITYGGYRISAGLSRLRLERADPNDPGCDTMNGNCVLVPRRAVSEIGIHSAHYSHSFGDIDYGHRARRAGYFLHQMPGPVGTTAGNGDFARKISRLTPATARFVLTHPKGLPVREWLHFCRMHGGPLWPVNFVVRYLAILRWS